MHYQPFLYTGAVYDAVHYEIAITKGEQGHVED